MYEQVGGFMFEWESKFDFVSGKTMWCISSEYGLHDWLMDILINGVCCVRACR